MSLKLGGKNLTGKLLLGTIYNLLGRWCERRLRGRGFVRPQKVYGLLQSGDMNEDYLLGLIRLIGRPGQFDAASGEIYAHPLAFDADEAAKRENPGGERELKALSRARVRSAIETAGFRPATYETLPNAEFSHRDRETQRRGRRKMKAGHLLVIFTLCPRPSWQTPHSAFE